MQTFLLKIKKAIADLLFDRGLVRKIRKSSVDNGRLYHMVLNGRITLQEYLRVAQPE